MNIVDLLSIDNNQLRNTVVESDIINSDEIPVKVMSITSTQTIVDVSDSSIIVSSMVVTTTTNVDENAYDEGSNRTTNNRQYKRLGYMIQCIFTLLGIGILMPWNAFISATDYFSSRLCEPKNDTSILYHQYHQYNNNNNNNNHPTMMMISSLTSMEGGIKYSNFESIFAIVFNLASVISLGLLITIQSLRDHYNVDNSESEHVVTTPGVVVNENSFLPLTSTDTYLSHHQTQLSDSVTSRTIPFMDNILNNNNNTNDNMEVGDIHHPLRNVQQQQQQQQQTIQPPPPTLDKYSFLSVILPLIVYVVVFLVQTCLVVILSIRITSTLPSTTQFYIITILCLIICGICTVISQSGIVATATQFLNPNVAISPYLQGQSIGGVAVSLANFIASTFEDPTGYRNVHCPNDINDDILIDTTKKYSTVTTTRNLLDDSSFNVGSDMNTNTESLVPTDKGGKNLSTRDIHLSRHSWINTFPQLYDPNVAIIEDHTTTTSLMSSSSSSCVMYQKVDWGIFFYFLAGSLTLVACTFGYLYVIKHQHEYNEYEKKNECNNNEQQERQIQYAVTSQNVRDDYETVRSHDGLEIVDEIHDTNVNNASNEHNLNFRNNNGLNDDPYKKRVGGRFLSDQSSSSSNNIELSSGIENDGLFRYSDSSHHMEDISNSPESYLQDNIVTEASLSTTGIVWKHAKIPILCIYFTFLVTLSLFPGWTSQLHSTNQCKVKLRIFNDLFIPFTFLLFNIGDLVGRYLASNLLLQKYLLSSSNLLYASLLRILFFPLLFMCPSGDENNELKTSFLNYQITSDGYSILTQFLFAVTNGLLLSLSFVHAPSLIPKIPNQQQMNDKYNRRLSEILNFSVAFGLLSGSLFSYPVLKLAGTGD